MAGIYQIVMLPSQNVGEFKSSNFSLQNKNQLNRSQRRTKRWEHPHHQIRLFFSRIVFFKPFGFKATRKDGDFGFCSRFTRLNHSIAQVACLLGKKQVGGVCFLDGATSLWLKFCCKWWCEDIYTYIYLWVIGNKVDVAGVACSGMYVEAVFVELFFTNACFCVDHLLNNCDMSFKRVCLFHDS